MAGRRGKMKGGRGEGSAADRAFDKRNPGLKEGSPREEAFDKRMKMKKGSRKRK